MTTTMLKLFFSISILHLVQGQDAPRTQDEVGERLLRCNGVAVETPPENSERRCEIFKNCTLISDLEEQYNTYSRDLVGLTEPDTNCTAITFGTYVDPAPFYDYIINQTETKATEFRCCFSTDIGMFEGERHVRKKYMKDTFRPSFVNDSEVWSIIEAAIENCPTYSPKCDGVEMAKCVFEACENWAMN